MGGRRSAEPAGNAYGGLRSEGRCGDVEGLLLQHHEVVAPAHRGYGREVRWFAVDYSNYCTTERTNRPTRKRTEIALEMVGQLEHEGHFPQARYAFDNGSIRRILHNLRTTEWVLRVCVWGR